MDKIQNTPQPDSHSRVDRVERAPDKRDRDQLNEEGKNFSDKMSGKKDKSEKGSDPALLAKPASSHSGEDSAGDAILSQFFGQNVKAETSLPNPMQLAQGAKVESAAPTSAVQDISRVAEVIADRILVSDSQMTDQKMISIRVKDDILPQTEIRITSGEAGALKIEVKTGNADAFNFLGSQKDGLVKHLQNTLPQSEISVSVDMDGAENDGQQGDGRSRNQRDIYEELQEQADADSKG